MTLGQKLRAARQRAGLTQSQTVGDRITRNMLSQIENDLAVPSMKTLEYLAATLGVSVSWLLADEAAERLPRARALYRTGDHSGCLALLEPSSAGAADEELLLLARCALTLAEEALAAERFEDASVRAAQALSWGERGLYASPGLQLRALVILARCAQARGDAEEAVGAYRQRYLLDPESVRYHLLLARYHLGQEHIQAAEREIWSIPDLPEAQKAEYLILRGRIAAKKEQYENARLYLQQAEGCMPLPPLLRRELYQAMELACRELGDYQAAYLYAARQLEMK